MDLLHNTGGQNVGEHGTTESPEVKLFPWVSFLKNYFEHDSIKFKTDNPRPESFASNRRNKVETCKLALSSIELQANFTLCVHNIYINIYSLNNGHTASQCFFPFSSRILSKYLYIMYAQTYIYIHTHILTQQMKENSYTHMLPPTVKYIGRRKGSNPDLPQF